MKLLILAGFVTALGFGQSGDCDTLEKCQEALKSNPRYSLAHFRLGEIYLWQTSTSKLRTSPIRKR